MVKVYFVRHQAAGVLWEHPFAQYPNADQVDALARRCFQTHGAIHARTAEPYWLRVDELELLGPNDIPVVPERSLTLADAVAGAAAGQNIAAGTGTVTPKEGL